MPIVCKVIVRRGVSPIELKHLGSALRRWYVRETREQGIALYTNPAAIEALCRGKRRGAIPLDVRSGRSYDRAATVDSFLKSVPSDLVEDVLIDGRSWNHRQ